MAGYSTDDYVKMIMDLKDKDPGQAYAIYNALSGMGGGMPSNYDSGALDIALANAMGPAEKNKWVNAMSDAGPGKAYGNAMMDPNTGKYGYYDPATGKIVNGSLEGYDPSKFDPSNVLVPGSVNYKPSNTFPGQNPATTATPKDSTLPGRTVNGTPAPFQPPNPPGVSHTPNAGDPLHPLQPGHTGPGGPGITTGPGARQPPHTQPWGSSPEAPNFASILQDLLKKYGPPGAGGPPAGGPPGTTNGPPGTNGPPPPPHGTSPYPNINAAAGTNPATYTGLPMRAFDPSLLIRDMRQHFQGASGAGQVHQMAPPDPQALQNNLQQWDQIFLRG
jgi:hypothetical protein